MWCTVLLLQFWILADILADYFLPTNACFMKNTLADIVNYEKTNIWQKKKEKNENCDMRKLRKNSQSIIYLCKGIFLYTFLYPETLKDIIQ